MASKTKQQIIKDLGDGLILRRAAPEDADELAQFNGRIFGGGGVSQYLLEQTLKYMSGRHPACRGARDFTVVEDTRQGRIVSSTCLTAERWSYGGITFGVGGPALVGTDPDYRKRGLMRAQFEIIHAWSARRGQVLQAMSGIPDFYRQFGYGVAIVPEPSRRGHRAGVPKLEEGTEEPYRVRPAAETDVDFMARTYRQGLRRSLVCNAPSLAAWRYGLGEFRIIETRRGERVGLLSHSPAHMFRESRVITSCYELKPGASWLAVTPSVLRYLNTVGEQWLVFPLGTGHPAYGALPDFLHPWDEPWGYDAMHVRVPDLPKFLRLIAPVLEQRLAASIAAGWSGELKLSFYRDGLRLRFRKGKLAVTEPWTPVEHLEGEESACFQGLTFLSMLFGTRSLQELRDASPECYARDHETRTVLGILFPKLPSQMCRAVT